MMIYVCGVWQPSESSMPVIYQHIFAFSLVNSHNLSTPRTSFSDRAPRLNSFHGEFVIKSYHKTAFKCSANAPKKWPKNVQIPPFCRNKYQNNFRP